MVEYPKHLSENFLVELEWVDEDKALELTVTFLYFDTDIPTSPDQLEETVTWEFTLGSDVAETFGQQLRLAMEGAHGQEPLRFGPIGLLPMPEDGCQLWVYEAEGHPYLVRHSPLTLDCPLAWNLSQIERSRATRP